MKPGNAIEVKDVKIKFKNYHDKSNTLKDRVIHWKRNKYESSWVLKGISFEVKKGQALGLIGSNGCGKSTTLKMLTRILYPNSGKIELSGRVSSLLELGAGFHPDLSGRENIFINASVFGLSRKEIKNRLDDIIAFSELEEYIDNPVRTYSSGMYMRLAFSVAINVDADILLIDEILAVGDITFQDKCFNRLMEIKQSGTTIVIVSHSMDQIERICDKCIWICDGLIKEEGTPLEVRMKYLDYMRSKKILKEGNNEENEDAVGEVVFESASLTDMSGNHKGVYFIGDELKLRLDLFAVGLFEGYQIEVNLVRVDGVFCYGVSTSTDQIECKPWEGRKNFTIVFSEMNLLRGKYYFDLHIIDNQGVTALFEGKVAEFEVENQRSERGMVYLKHEWIKE